MSQISNREKYLPLILAEQLKYNIPNDLLVKLIQQESAFDSDIISGKRLSPAGARGIGQFMPATADRLAKELGIQGEDKWKPEPQIRMAGKYMDYLYKRYKKNANSFTSSNAWELAVAAYNAGEGKIDKALKLASNTSAWIHHVKEETQKYVSKIFYSGLGQVVTTAQKPKKINRSATQTFFDQFGVLEPVLQSVNSLPAKKIEGMATFLKDIGKGKLTNPF